MNTTTVDLRAEALVEARRLATLRAVAPDRDPGAPPVDATLGYVHRTRLRHRLGGWMLLIWRAACEDASGRIAASAIVPMLVRRGRDRRGRETGSWLRNVVGAIGSDPPEAMRSALIERQRELIERCGRRVQARLARERAIASRVAQSNEPSPAYQSGLFDRRSERAHRQQAGEAQAAEELADIRVGAAESAADLAPSRPRLLLALVP